MSAMSEKQKSTFMTRASQIGHDSVTLATKGEQYTVKKVASIDELRTLLGPGGETERKAFSKAVGSAPASSARHAAHQHVFGTGTLSAEHADFVEKSLPVEVKVASIENKTLQPNEVWDLGTSTTPVVINVGTLTMMKGSRIVIRNTALSFTCQKLIRES